jgi:transcriptional regulator with XRE-family HTH domain
MPSAAISDEMRARLREAMEYRGLKQKQLARVASLGENAVGYVLNGEVDNPSTATFLALLSALRVNAQWIVMGDGPKYSDESGQASATMTRTDLPIDRWVREQQARLAITNAEKVFLRTYPWPDHTTELPSDVYEAILSHHRLITRLIAG